MNPQLTKIFCSLEVEPRQHLCQDICHVIELREKRARNTKLIGYSVLAVLSIIIIVPATTSLVHQFGNSAFGQYASLVFSDAGVLAGYWKQFGITLIESVPIFSLTVVLGMVLMLGWSTRRILRQTKRLSLSVIHA
jgi:predicted nucleic acid-binding Zn ribbon protein